MPILTPATNEWQEAYFFMVQGTKATLKAEALETEMKSQVLSYLSSLSISDLNNINLTKWNSKEFVSLNLVENVKKKNLGNA